MSPKSKGSRLLPNSVTGWVSVDGRAVSIMRPAAEACNSPRRDGSNLQGVWEKEGHAQDRPDSGVCVSAADNGTTWLMASTAVFLMATACVVEEGCRRNGETDTRASVLAANITPDYRWRGHGTSRRGLSIDCCPLWPPMASHSHGLQISTSNTSGTDSWSLRLQSTLSLFFLDCCAVLMCRSKAKVSLGREAGPQTHFSLFARWVCHELPAGP